MSSQFQFVIPADGIASGDHSSSVTVVADRGLIRTATPRVLVATFGEGYEQRVADGVNPNNQTFAINFANREAAKIYQIAAYFDAIIGKSFTLTVTDHSGNTNIKVVVETYNITYISENFHTLSAELRRVYEP